MITVVTIDGVSVTLTDDFVSKCGLLKMLVEETNVDSPISISNVNSNLLERMIHYSKTGDLGDGDMLPLLCACDYFQYDEMLDHGAKVVAESLRGRSQNEIRRMFGLAV
jgi:hypothetical protein